MKADFKMQAHLIGEAFPDCFTITLVIRREANGALAPTCDIICNPQNAAEI